MTYTTLTPAQVSRGLRQIAADAQVTFGGIDSRRLNWKPDVAAWSVAQCLEHLLAANHLMRAAATQALDNPPWSMWQRVPLLPRALGRALIRSQSPDNTRKYKASPKAEPARSDISADVVRQFIDQQHELASWVETVDERRAGGTIMVSPFIRVITYSVLDGCRLIVAHDCRHVEQAKRVMTLPGFPLS